MRYQIGAKVVYPLHGAGVIESVEEREIMGTKQMYYILRIPVGDMKVMIPMDTAGEIGLRDVISSSEAEHVLEEFKNYPVELGMNWNKRQRKNMALIKSGNLYDVVRVVKNLMYRDMVKGLSTSERKMLSGAKQIVISELVIAKSCGQKEIESLMEDIVTAEL